MVWKLIELLLIKFGKIMNNGNARSHFNPKQFEESNEEKSKENLDSEQESS